VGFEPTIPASERAKTVHALDRSATVTGAVCNYKNKIQQEQEKGQSIIFRQDLEFLIWLNTRFDSYVTALTLLQSYISELLISLSMVPQPLVGPWSIFSFLLPHTDSRTPWTSDQPVTRPLPTRRTTQRQNKHTQTSMPWVGFEPTIPTFKRAKTVHVLDSLATEIGRQIYNTTLTV
jgi:hypothetical protein